MPDVNCVSIVALISNTQLTKLKLRLQANNKIIANYFAAFDFLDHFRTDDDSMFNCHIRRNADPISQYALAYMRATFNRNAFPQNGIFDKSICCNQAISTLNIYHTFLMCEANA